MRDSISHIFNDKTKTNIRFKGIIYEQKIFLKVTFFQILLNKTIFIITINVI